MDPSPIGSPGQRKYLSRGPTIPGGIGIKLSRDGTGLKGKVTNLRRQLSKADSNKVSGKSGRGASKKRQEIFASRPNSACFTDASDEKSEKSSNTSKSENVEAIEPLGETESEANEIASETIERGIVVDPAHLPTKESPEVTNRGVSSSKIEAKVETYPEAPPFPEENVSIGAYSKSPSFGKLSLYDLEEENKVIDSAEHQKGAPSVKLAPEKKLSAEDAFYLSNMTPRHATSPTEAHIISCDEYWRPQSIGSDPQKGSFGTAKPAFDEQSSFETDLGPDCVDSHPSKFYSTDTNSFPQGDSSSCLEPCSGYSAVESIFLNKDTSSQNIRNLLLSNPGDQRAKQIPDAGPNEAMLKIKSANSGVSGSDDIPLSEYDRSVALLKNQGVEVSSQSLPSGIDDSSLKTLAHPEDSSNGYSCATPRNRNGSGASSDESLPREKVAAIKSDEKVSGSTAQSLKLSKGQVGAVVFWAVAGFFLLVTKALLFASVNIVKLVPFIVQKVIAWRQNQLLTASDHDTSNETDVQPTVIVANETATNVGPQPSGFVQARIAQFSTEYSPRFLVTVARSPRLVYQFVEQKLGWLPRVETMPTSKSTGEGEREGDDAIDQQVSTEFVNVSSLQRCHSEPNEEAFTEMKLKEPLPEQIENECASSTAEEIVPLEVSGIVDRKSNSQIEQPTTESDLKVSGKSDLNRLAKKASTSDKIKKIMPNLRSLSFKSNQSKGSFNKSRPESEDGSAMKTLSGSTDVLRTPSGSSCHAVGSNASSNVGDANFARISKRLSKTTNRKSKHNPKLDGLSGKSSDSASKIGGHMSTDEDLLEKGKNQSKSPVGEFMKKMPKAIMKSLKSMQNKDVGKSNFSSTRSAKKTLWIISDVCTNDLRLKCSEKKGGALRLVVSKELSSSSRIRAKIDIEPTDDYSSNVIFTRDKGDKSTEPQFSALVNEVQQLYLAKICQGKPTSDSPRTLDIQD